MTRVESAAKFQERWPTGDHAGRPRRPARSPAAPVPRFALGMRDGHHENARRLLPIGNQVRKARHADASGTVEVDRPPLRGLGDLLHRRVELLEEALRDARIAFGVPSGGLLAFFDGLGVKLKEFRADPSRLRRCGAEPPSTGSA